MHALRGEDLVDIRCSTGTLAGDGFTVESGQPGCVLVERAPEAVVMAHGLNISHR